MIQKTSALAIAGVVLLVSAPPATAQGRKGAGEPYRIGDGIEPPKIRTHRAPRYPEEAKANRVQGPVVVEAVIDSAGRVSDTKILSGDERLHGAATEAVRAWVFEPATRRGKAVPVYFPVTVNFRLPGTTPHASTAVEKERDFDRWRENIERIDDHLAKGQFDEAARSSRDVIENMLRIIGTGRAGTAYLSAAVAQQALASAGLGDAADATWLWHVAVAIHPPLEEMGVGRHGTALETMLAEEAARLAAMPLAASEPPMLREPALTMPLGARALGLRDRITITAHVDESGRPLAPRIDPPTDKPTLAYATLQAFRQRRYEPSTRDGQPAGARVSATITIE